MVGLVLILGLYQGRNQVRNTLALMKLTYTITKQAECEICYRCQSI